MSNTKMKLSLNIKLIGDRKVEITIKYVKESLLCDITTAFEHTYTDKETGVSIWSFQDFMFDESQIRLPDKKYKCDNMSYTHKFATEKDRYKTLKKYYTSLGNWSKDEELFPIQDDRLFDDRVTLYEDWWFIN
jgi:hypothetical protein